MLQLTDTDEEHGFGGSMPPARAGRRRVLPLPPHLAWEKATQPTGGTARPTTSSHPRPPAEDTPTPVQKQPQRLAPADHRITNTSTTTILRILRHLAKYSAAPLRRGHRTHGIRATAVAVGYLRQPEMDLPTPGADFARRISTLLATAADRPDVTNTLPHDRILESMPPRCCSPLAGPSPAETSKTAHQQVEKPQNGEHGHMKSTRSACT
uniref:Uncharacterized protein n=1 Tax=Streptomyces avermitilis TaxID=33903 RepID=A0A499VTJ8_STRAX|nr:hypothetical protein SAVMC3_89690 [Streptomyces avermitilis]